MPIIPRPKRHFRHGKPLGMKDVSRVMDLMMNTTGLGDLVGEKELLSRWSEVVGEEVARHVQLIDVKGEFLVLKTESSVWKNEINFRKKAILLRSNELIGKTLVRGIRFL